MPITIENLHHIYMKNTPFQFEALTGASCIIHDGEFVAIIGQTGSGKSTLIQHINALLLPSQGEVHVNGTHITPQSKIKQVKSVRKTAGLVFQFPEYQLFEETIEKDIAFGPKNFGVKGEALDKLVLQSLLKVGLKEEYLKKSPFELSGGQKRRIAIAGILAMEPEILILDEPTAGLDPQGAKEMMDLFLQINKQNKTIILVSHDMDHVLKYCKSVIVLKNGKVVRKTTPTELFFDDVLLEEVSIEAPLVIQTAKMMMKEGVLLDQSSIKDVKSLAAAFQKARGNRYE